MDRIDIAGFMFTSFTVAWLAEISGVQLVCAQALWLGALWIGKRLIDRHLREAL